MVAEGALVIVILSRVEVGLDVEDGLIIAVLCHLQDHYLRESLPATSTQHLVALRNKNASFPVGRLPRIQIGRWCCKAY